MISDRVRCTLACGLGTMHFCEGHSTLYYLDRASIHGTHLPLLVSFLLNSGMESVGNGSGGILADSFNGCDNERGPQRRRHTLTLEMSDLVVVEEEDDFIVAEIEESVVN
jgi:hypothetical protein